MSEIPPPLPIDYLTPRPREPKPPIPHLWGKFLIGLLGSSTISAATYFGGFSLSPKISEEWLLVALCVIALGKLATGITLTCIRNWRPMGIGLLIALPLGGLIFFGACAANLRM